MDFHLFCSNLKCCPKLYVSDVRHIVIVLYSPMSCYQLHTGDCRNLSAFCHGLVYEGMGVQFMTVADQLWGSN